MDCCVTLWKSVSFLVGISGRGETSRWPGNTGRRTCLRRCGTTGDRTTIAPQTSPFPRMHRTSTSAARRRASRQKGWFQSLAIIDPCGGFGDFLIYHLFFFSRDERHFPTNASFRSHTYKNHRHGKDPHPPCNHPSPRGVRGEDKFNYLFPFD